MTGLRYLVVGGHGFLGTYRRRTVQAFLSGLMMVRVRVLSGSHIVEGLLARGEEDVHVFDAVDSHLFRNEPNVR
jgi:nucleoside-diphosphate-sugar epimerase